MNLRTILSISAFAFMSCQSEPVKINKTSTLYSSKLGEVRLYHDEKGFIIKKDGELIPVQNCFIDKELRDKTTKEIRVMVGEVVYMKVNGKMAEFEKLTRPQLERFLREDHKTEHIQADPRTTGSTEECFGTSGYIKIEQMSDGEYTLKYFVRLNGGGVGGFAAGVWTGKFLGEFVCHGGIAVVGCVVSLIATPATGLVVAVALEKTLIVPIEVFSNSMAMAGGITGGVLTGPV